MSTPNPIRILLVEDHAVVREGLAQLLSLRSEFQVVGQAGTGAEGVRLFSALRPDVTLMDLNLPQLDGVAATESIHRDFPDACIVILTTYDNDERILSALRAGARLYLLKSASSDDLFRAVRDAAQGRAHARRSLAFQLQSRFDRDPLSGRENEVLHLMVEGMTNDEIAARLGLKPNTVKTHVSAVLHKLNVERRTEAVAKALQLGIVSSPPANS